MFLAPWRQCKKLSTQHLHTVLPTYQLDKTNMVAHLHIQQTLRNVFIFIPRAEGDCRLRKVKVLWGHSTITNVFYIIIRLTAHLKYLSKQLQCFKLFNMLQKGTPLSQGSWLLFAQMLKHTQKKNKKSEMSNASPWQLNWYHHLLSNSSTAGRCATTEGIYQDAWVKAERLRAHRCAMSRAPSSREQEMDGWRMEQIKWRAQELVGQNREVHKEVAVPWYDEWSAPK